MLRYTRRDALLVGAAACVGACSDGPHVDPAGAEAMPPCSLDAIVDSLLAERDDALSPLAAWLARSTPTDALYAAALIVGARTTFTEVDMHTVLVVNAAHLLAERAPADLVLMPLFYAWHAQLGAVLLSVDADPQPLPELTAAAIPEADAALMTLLAALDSWDAAAAEGAVVALYLAGGRDAVIDPLTRYGQRNHDWVGHTAIWTAYAFRALDALGYECAPWILRSLVRAMCANRDRSSTSAFDANLLRVQEVAAGWRDGVDDPTAVPALLDVFRSGDATACVDAAIAHLNVGGGPRTLWTALAVCAVELAVRWQHASWGVHELDALNALRHLQALTPSPDTAVLALLQAAAWRPEFRAFVDESAPVVSETLDAMAPAVNAPADLDAVFAALDGNRVEAARVLVAYFDAGGSEEAMIDAWPAIIAARAGEDAHHYKYNVALLEETEAALPSWRRTLLLGITMRGPSSLSPLWARHDDAAAIIATL